MLDIKVVELTEYEGVPVLVLDTGMKIPKRSEEATVKGYLSPFRGYCMQVSGTVSGGSDRGSTQVFGLKNILKVNNADSGYRGYESNLSTKEMQKEFIYMTSQYAIMKFADYVDANHDGYRIPQMCRYDDHDLYSAWVDKVYDFINEL